MTYFPSGSQALPKRRFYRWLFCIAGIYNLLWGAYTCLDPGWVFRLADMKEAHYPQLFACLAMVVGVYGFVYLEIARVPERGWSLAAVGLLGKVAGPIGMVYLIATEQWKPGAIWLCVTNDFIWWIPFAIYLRDTWPFFRDDLQGGDALRKRKDSSLLYPSVLGDQFLLLHPMIQDFHRGDLRGRGVFSIKRSPGLKARLFSLTAPLPAPSPQVEVVLQVVANPNCEIWQRSFAGKPFVSVQYVRSDASLAERAGWIEFLFQLQVKEGELHYKSRMVRLCLGPLRLRLPQWMTIQIQAVEKAALEDGTIHTEVMIDDFRGQRLFSYGGKLKIQAAGG